MATAVYDNSEENLHDNYTTYYAYDPWDPFELLNVHNNRIFYSVSIASPIAIFVGVFANIFVFAVLVKSRLWLKHEGYVYLAANFCANVGILLFCTSSFWMTSVYGKRQYYPPETSNFMCKVWHFFMSIFFASGWLSVALVFNVYLREHLIHRRRCGCPIFASKYCTLFASKIVVGVIFSVLFVLGLPYVAIFKIGYRGLHVCYPSDHLTYEVTMLIESIIMWVLPFVFFLPIILLIVLCTKREGNTFGFSQIEERSASDEQMRVVAVTLSSMTLFSQFVLVFFHRAYTSVGLTVTIELIYALSIAIQPILCFIILKSLRDEFRSQLRKIRCCRSLCPSLDAEEGVVRLNSIQEDPPSTTEP